MSKQSEQISLEDSDQALLDLLRTKGLSIKNLDEPTKQELRSFLFRLHHERGLSLSDVARLIGNKTSGYTSWVCKQLGVQVRPFEESRLKAIREKRRKYERRPFDGTAEEKAYLLGLRHGDLSVSKPWRGVVRVSTSTTHPAMAELFHSLFSRYGHVYQYPRFKGDMQIYEWNLQTILDGSFGFLDDVAKKSRDQVSAEESTLLHYVAGVWDAEGTIGIYRNSSVTAIHLVVFNTNLDLLNFVKKQLTRLGYHPLGPYLDKRRGMRSPKFHIEMKRDYWKVVVAIFEESQSLLRRLPMRHPEKVARKRLALSLRRGEYWEDVRPRVATLRGSVIAAKNRFAHEAEKNHLRRLDRGEG